MNAPLFHRPVRLLPAIALCFLTLFSAFAAEKSTVPVRKQPKEAPAPPQIPKPPPEKKTAPDKKASPEKKAATDKNSPAAKKAAENLLKLPPAPKVDWRPEYYQGRAYVPVEQVASYYDMQKPQEEGKVITLHNKNFTVEITRGERRVKLNKWTFYFSFTVVQRSGKTLVSTFDVRNVLDPIMRPNDRRDPAVLKTVVIDPAGGGKETGIKSPFIAEKELTLDVATQLAEKLKAAGFRVVLTRDSDTLVSAAQRQKAADAVNDEAIFISLRASSGSGTTRGFETCTLPPAGTPATNEADGADIDRRFFAGNINDRESLALATTLQSSAVTNLRTPDLGIKRFRFGELRDINMPAVVCRMGYLSHKEEALKLSTPEHRTQVAQSLFEGVQRYARYLSDHLEERLEEEKKRPLHLGTITATSTVEGAGITGEQMVLEVPIVAAETVNVDRSRVEVQLFLFEHIDTGEIDVTTSDTPKVEWVSVLPDWKTSRTELLRATYLRPPFGAAETKAYGKRSYHGYVARLIYDGRVMDEASSPPNLNRCLYYFTSVFPRR
ncbi:MAG TPA: N-acetylmuramoyl-L-alanine amidase [Verrucomicrobiales bacterium]|jgi:N-acetylmuramoyl-L-alanine amidase|nr:N-acetylmuramoyl-L-alanine amidase [Verrucomicrobiales bacterium]